MHDEVDIYDRDQKPIALGRHTPPPATLRRRADGADNHHSGAKNWTKTASGVPDPHPPPQMMDNPTETWGLFSCDSAERVRRHWGRQRRQRWGSGGLF